MTEEHFLDIEKWAAHQQISKAALQDAKLEVFDNVVMPALLYRLEKELLTDTHGRMERTIYFPWPATWWDHLKLRLGWSWLKVNYQHSAKEVKWEAKSIFPEATHYPKQFGRRVKYVTFSEKEV